MTLYNYVKRRCYKALPLIKRVVIPIGVFFLILHMFSNSSSKVNIDENIILPGEALDPMARKSDGLLGRRAHEPQKSRVNREINKSSKDEVLRRPNQLKEEQISPVNKRKYGVTNNQESLRNSKQKMEEQVPQINRHRYEEKSVHSEDERVLPPPPNPNGITKDGQQKTFDDSDVPPRIKTEWSMAKANIPDAHKVKFRGHAITNDTITLTLLSSADKVFMSINKREIYRSIGRRGLHVVVLNQYSGRVMAKRIFDTFMKGVEEDMVDFLDDIVDGRIVVFAVLDEVATGLTWKGRNALIDMGCRFSEKIAYRDMWAMATRKGGMKIAETYSNVATADTGYEWGGPIFMRTDFDLEEEPVECKWSYNERNQARRQFCIRYEGYGAMCRCDVAQWDDAFFKINENLHNQLSQNPMFNQLGVVILATNRPHNLYRTLKSLHEAPGFNKNMLAIYTEQATREVVALAKLFGVTAVETGKTNSTAPKNIRSKVQRVFRDIAGSKFNNNHLPEDTLPPFSASNLLILEEDMEVSIDIFKYFHNLAPILDADKSVLAISAFNYNGFREVSSSQTTFYRTSDANGLALMLPTRTINEILVPKWSTLKDNDEWWHELYNAMDKNKADIIYPEVSRAKHSSYEGYLIKGEIQLDNFKDHVLSMTTEYEISKDDVMRLQRASYKNSIEEVIRNSKKIIFDFCKHELIYGQEPNVMFVTFDGKDDRHIRYVLKCLKAWNAYPAGGWRDVWQFHFHGRVLTIVGVPSSPFSKFKTMEDTAVTAPPEALTTTTTPKPSREAS